MGKYSKYFQLFKGKNHFFSKYLPNVLKQKKERKELRKEINILKEGKNKTEAHNKILSKAHIKLLSENENLRDELSHLKIKKEHPTSIQEIAPNPVGFTPDQAYNLKIQVKEKKKLIKLREKVKELEKDTNKIRRKFENEEKGRERDLGELRKELNTTLEKASILCEENNVLKEQVQKYEEREKVLLVSASCQMEEVKEKETDIDRRSHPSSETSAVPKAITVTQGEHNCNLCKFKSNSELQMNQHLDHKHHKCDICSQILKTQLY